MFKKFFREYLRKKNVQKLIRGGVLKPVESFEEYSTLVKEAKKNAEHRLFTNCYMMPDEIKRLTSQKRFYQMQSDNGVVFVDDEISHYYMFFYLDLTKKITVPQLDRNILAENVYIEDKMTQQQTAFENLLGTAGFNLVNTWQQIYGIPQLAPEKFWKKYHSAMKFLSNDGKHICAPSNKQLKEFEKIYREQINVYTQRRFTKRERRRQRDNGRLHCVADDKGRLYAIAISAEIFGGAIAAKKEFDSNGYAPALMIETYKGFYENMPADPQQQKEYMRCRAFGWIATTNTVSLRLHKSIGLYTTGKAMHQFVLPGFAN